MPKEAAGGRGRCGGDRNSRARPARAGSEVDGQESSVGQTLPPRASGPPARGGDFGPRKVGPPPRRTAGEGLSGRRDLVWLLRSSTRRGAESCAPDPGGTQPHASPFTVYLVAEAKARAATRLPFAVGPLDPSSTKRLEEGMLSAGQPGRDHSKKQSAARKTGLRREDDGLPTRSRKPACSWSSLENVGEGFTRSSFGGTTQGGRILGHSKARGRQQPAKNTLRGRIGPASSRGAGQCSRETRRRGAVRTTLVEQLAGLNGRREEQHSAILPTGETHGP